MSTEDALEAVSNEGIYQLLGILYTDDSERRRFMEERGNHDRAAHNEVRRMVSPEDLERVAVMLKARIRDALTSTYPRSCKILSQRFEMGVATYLSQPRLAVGTDLHEIVDQFGPTWLSLMRQASVPDWIIELGSLEYSVHAIRWSKEEQIRGRELVGRHDLTQHLRAWPDSDGCGKSCTAHVVRLTVGERGGMVTVSRRL